MWETKAYLLNNRFRLVKTFGNIISGILAHGIDITGVIHAKTSGTSGNLPYLRNIKRAGGNAVILFCLDKNNSSYRKIQSHTDGIGGNHYFCFVA